MVVSVFSAVCCLRADICMLCRPAIISAGTAASTRCFMADFLTSCFDVLFNLISQTNNLLIALPFFAIIISVLFGLVFKLIRGDYR